MAKGTFKFAKKICPFLKGDCEETNCMMWDDKHKVCQLAYPAKIGVKGRRMVPFYMSDESIEVK